MEIRRATAEGDILRKADLYANLVSLCGPYLKPETEEAFRVLPSVGRFDKGGEERALNLAIERHLSGLLRHLAGRGIYAYLPGETADAGSLALADPAEDGEEEDKKA